MAALKAPRFTPTSTTERNIGLWGAPGSGKTTFLGVLFRAVLGSPLDLRLTGVDDASTDFMTTLTDLLARREFPPATDAVRSLAWELNMTAEMQVPRTVTVGRRTQTVYDRQAVGRRTRIEMRDAPGVVYGSDSAMQPPPSDRQSNLVLPGAAPGAAPASAGPQGPVPPTAEIIDHLSGCTGMILLINPIKERADGSAFRYFQSTLARVAQRKLAQLAPGSRLPHSIAVCMNLFDHPEVFSFSQQGRYHILDQTGQRFPRIPGDRAEEFLTEFCGSSSLSDIDEFCATIKRFFNPAQVRFYVTSSIGFYTEGARAAFREADYQNTAPKPGGPDTAVMIRGRVSPINVLEPLLWLSGLHGQAPT